jgi:multiple sugar transport system permease protein
MGAKTISQRRERSARIFILPAIVVLLLVVLVPLLASFVLSFTEWHFLEQDAPTFVGLRNYLDVLTDKGDLSSLAITLRFVLIAVAIEVGLGFAIALLLDAEFKGRGIFRLVTLLPFMISEVVVALMWRYIFQTDNGVLNYILTLFGQDPRVWIDAENAFTSIVIMEVWQNTPFAILVLMAALAGVSESLVEAAKIDGAGYLRRLWHVVIPAIRPQLFVVITFRVMFTLRVFTQPYVLTGGGPADLTRVAGIDIFQKAFRYYDLGMANAMSWVLITITVVIVVILNLLRGRTED